MGSYTPSYNFPNLADHNISSTLGFLSDQDPLTALPEYFKAWDDLASSLPSLIASKTLRQAIKTLPLLDATRLSSRGEYQRAFVVLGFLIHAWVWLDGAERPEPNVPMVLGEPYLVVCEELGMEKTLSYAGLCLWNWRVKSGVSIDSVDALGDVEQLGCHLSFTGTRDEDVFYLVPVMTEEMGGKLVKLLLDAMEAAWKDDDGPKVVVTALNETSRTLQRVAALMKILHEQCDPMVFYQRVRPFYPGAKGMELKGMPNGVLFERKDGNKVSVIAVGGSAAQSALFPFLDLCLGVQHGPLTGEKGETVFEEMRSYTPFEHRQLLATVAGLPSIKSFVEQRSEEKELKEAYNSCLKQLAAWRSKHIGVVTTHIVTPARKLAPSAQRPLPEEVREGLSVKDEAELQGTGGSALIPFLKQTRLDTVEAAV